MTMTDRLWAPTQPSLHWLYLNVAWTGRVEQLREWNGNVEGSSFLIK